MCAWSSKLKSRKKVCLEFGTKWFHANHRVKESAPGVWTSHRWVSKSRWRIFLTRIYWNMSGHALMGRPAARLETMALVFSSYVLVCVICKRRWIYLYGCYFLIYVMILPCSLQKPLTRNQTLFNVWLHIRTYHSRNLTKLSYLVQ